MLELLMVLIAAEPTIVLHEWGVVFYGGGSVQALGDPGDLFQVEEAVAFAPVIHLYGPAFTGEVSVAALGGIFDMHPEPDVLGGPGMMMGGLGSFIRWQGIEALPAETMESLQFMPVQGLDAAPLWRPREALTLTRADGFSDKFLYYEVDLAGTEFPLPLAGHAQRGIPLTAEVLLFHRSVIGIAGYELLQQGDLSMAGGTAPFLYSGSEVRAVLGRWAGNTLSESELDALWATWEPYVLFGDWDGSSLAVFPLPDQVIELVSTVSAKSDQGYPVTVHRFFLGMMAMP
jgi:hypothetical protein